MPAEHFRHVTTWVFDLDNTLYPPGIGLFDQIEARMNGWIMRHLGLDLEASSLLRARYWRDHGTTLAGLMQDHQIPPDDYLADVHDIDFSGVPADPALAQAIARLPGRAIVYTNGDSAYAQRVLERRGLSGLFAAVYGVEHADYRPKPEAAAFAKVFARDGLDPAHAAMFEDDPRNLAVPHALGMRTVHVAPEALVQAPAHIEHHTADLTGFLQRLTAS